MYPPFHTFQTITMLRWMSTNAVLRNHAQHWINRYESMIDRDTLLNIESWATESMLYQDFHNAPATDPATAGDSLVDFAPSGFVSMRSSWADNATALYFLNSEWNCDHQHRNCGHYTIVRNKRVVTSNLGGYWGANYPACQDTIAHNAILIENPGKNDSQTGSGIDYQAGVTETSVDSDDQFGYVMGEYGNTFNFTGWNGTDMTGNYVVKNARRKILWIKPDLFVLHDYIKLYANKAPRWKSLVHHFQGRPTSSNGLYTCFSDSNRMLFQTVLPVAATQSVIRDDTAFTGFSKDGVNDGQRNYMLRIDAGNANDAETFLNVICLTDSNSIAPMPVTTTFTNSTGGFTGTQIATPGTQYVWLCKLGPGITNALDYSAGLATNPIQHIVTDVPPAATLWVRTTTSGARIDVTIRNTDFPGATRLLTSDGGTLKFVTTPTGAIIARAAPSASGREKAISYQ
jgi:hypothetical protein